MRFKVGELVKSKDRYGDQNGGMGVIIEVSRGAVFENRRSMFGNPMIADCLTIYWSNGESTKEADCDVERRIR